MVVDKKGRKEIILVNEQLATVDKCVVVGAKVV